MEPTSDVSRLLHYYVDRFKVRQWYHILITFLLLHLCLPPRWLLMYLLSPYLRFYLLICILRILPRGYTSISDVSASWTINYTLLLFRHGSWTCWSHGRLHHLRFAIGSQVSVTSLAKSEWTTLLWGNGVQRDLWGSRWCGREKKKKLSN